MARHQHPRGTHQGASTAPGLATAACCCAAVTSMKAARSLCREGAAARYARMGVAELFAAAVWCAASGLNRLDTMGQNLAGLVLLGAQQLHRTLGYLGRG